MSNCVPVSVLQSIQFVNIVNAIAVQISFQLMICPIFQGHIQDSSLSCYLLHHAIEMKDKDRDYEFGIKSSLRRHTISSFQRMNNYHRHIYSLRWILTRSSEQVDVDHGDGLNVGQIGPKWDKSSLIHFGPKSVHRDVDVPELHNLTS